MKRSRYKPLIQPAGNATRRLSDRGAALTLLASPIALSLLCLVLAIVLSVIGHANYVEGTLRQYTATFAYTTLLLAGMFLPAYLAGFAWYWWRTRANGDTLVRSLLWLPIAAALIAWFPSLVISGSKFDAVQIGQSYALLASITLIAGYLWVGLVRLTLRYWRAI